MHSKTQIDGYLTIHLETYQPAMPTTERLHQALVRQTLFLQAGKESS